MYVNVVTIVYFPILIELIPIITGQICFVNDREEHVANE